MTKTEKWIAGGLIALWAVLFVPHLRTSPNWYGDEGEWMEKSWTFIHGTPRVGPVTNDFVFPYPYPPLYMLVTGSLLRVFGNDIMVARAFGAVTALGAAALLFWIGCRLRDKAFGFLCAAAFLVYAESVMNFRWVRSHPMAGTLALASCGFMIRYVQEKKLRDALLAGLMCSLATATNYFTYPLIGAVIVTVAVANWRQWWHAVAACAVAGSYGAAFAVWHVATKGGAGHLLAQVHLLTSVASNEVRPTLWGEVARFCQNVWTLGFKTPTEMGPRGWQGRDWWLVIATLGFLWLPVTRAKWLRAWIPFWLLILMYGVFKKLNNVPLFFYPATIFLPLMAMGFASVLAWAGEGLQRIRVPGGRVLPVLVMLPFAWQSLDGAVGGFASKIDLWSQRSVKEAEAAMALVNANTTGDDMVMVPKQIYWLVKNAKKSMLTFSPRYDGVVNDMPVPVLIPRELYWFDCRWQNAKYLVLASGIGTDGQPRGIDLVYARNLTGVQEVVDGILREQWPIVYHGGSQVALVNVGNGKQWPVTVGGEYLVMQNPRFNK
jgi:hypothetical protein